MGRFSKRVAQTLAKAGHETAAKKLTENGWLIEGRVGEGESEKVQVDGKLFNLITREGLALLSATILQIQRTRRQVTAKKVAPGVSNVRITYTAPTADPMDGVAEQVVRVIEQRVAPYRDNPWFSVTGPYRLWQKSVSDRKALADRLKQQRNFTVNSLADRLLQESGFSEGFHSAMERLMGLERCDVICDLWAALTSPSAHRWHQSVEWLAAVGACPLPGRDEALRRSLPLLVARLLVIELETRDAVSILQTLFGSRRQTSDLDVLGRVHEASREHLGEIACDLIGGLVNAWKTPLPALPQTPGIRSDVWSALRHVSRTDPVVPAEVMRSLLDAALRLARDRQVYGLPEVEYWVRVQDRFLNGLGVDRFQIRLLSPGSMSVLCAPTSMSFPLQLPPSDVTQGALYIVMMAALAYAEMVTRRDQLPAEGVGGAKMYHLKARPSTGGKVQHRPVQVGRVTPQKTSHDAISGSRTGQVHRAASYVVPHLRWLWNGEATEHAVTAAAEHGIRIPDGYTFVRGHFRGEGIEQSALEYGLVDVALETVRRFQSRPNAVRR